MPKICVVTNCRKVPVHNFKELWFKLRLFKFLVWDWFVLSDENTAAHQALAYAVETLDCAVHCANTGFRV